MTERARGIRKQREGVVISDKMEKTVVVAVESRGPHPLYQRIVKHTKRLTAHNEDNRAKVGDRVRVMETRPISKRKRWLVTDILEEAK